MKKLYFLLPLLLAFTFLTCDDDKTKDDPPPPPPPTLDQRLVGEGGIFLRVMEL